MTAARGARPAGFVPAAHHRCRAASALILPHPSAKDAADGVPAPHTGPTGPQPQVFHEGSGKSVDDLDGWTRRRAVAGSLRPLSEAEVAALRSGALTLTELHQRAPTIGAGQGQLQGRAS